MYVVTCRKAFINIKILWYKIEINVIYFKRLNYVKLFEEVNVWVLLFIQFSRKKTNTLLSIYISGNMFRLIAPSSEQLKNGIGGTFIDVHIVGSQTFTIEWQ